MKLFRYFSKNFCEVKNKKPYLQEINLRNFVLNENSRLDKFIQSNFKLNWGIVQMLIRKKDIFILRGNKKKIFEPITKLEITDRIFIPSTMLQQKEIKTLDIVKNLNEIEKNDYSLIFHKMRILETESFVVLNKYNNLPTQGGTAVKFSVDNILKYFNLELSSRKNNVLTFTTDEYKIVHRLDKPVSGLIIVAKTINFAREFSKSNQENKSEKIYISLNSKLPKYIRELSIKNLLNFNNNETFLKSFSGLITSNENADKFIIKIDNGYYFTHSSILEESEKVNENITEINEMMGKFSITHLIFYNKSFIIFNLLEIGNYNKEKKLELFKYLKDDKFECYSIMLYELITGKKHQIRKHLTKCFFTPIFNDEKYLFNQENLELYKIFSSLFNPNKQDEEIEKTTVLEKYGLNNPFYSIYLHSLQIKFDKDINGENIKFVSKFCSFQNNNDNFIIKTYLPENFTKILNKIKANEIIDFYNSNTYLKLI